jgi:hypothetical protein
MTGKTASTEPIYVWLILKLLRNYVIIGSRTRNPPTHSPTHSKAAVKRVYKAHHTGDGNGGFCTAIGPQAISIQFLDPDGDWAHDAKRFWKQGFMEPSVGHDRTECNPLFAYSQAGGDNLALRLDTSPILGFHLVTSLSKLTPNSPYHLETVDTDGPLDNAVKAAKLQFRSWCDAFRKLVRKSSDGSALRLRFFVGDAIRFVIALNQLRGIEVGEIGNGYGRVGSATPLHLDADDYCTKAKTPAPLSFDVVDISYLGDSIGFLNLVPYITPLFKSVSAVLYANIRMVNGAK